MSHEVMNSIVITRPYPKDRKEIHDVFAVVIQESFIREGLAVSHANELKEEINYQLPTLDRDLHSNGLDEYYLVARKENRIVGTIAYGTVNAIIKENYSYIDSNTPEIKSVYILPDWQGIGIGTLLFTSMLHCLSEKNSSAFCLDCGYTQTQGFWHKKLGLPLLVLKNYWGENAHHLIWYGKVSDFILPATPK